jgi:hypothetical protein
LKRNDIILIIAILVVAFGTIVFFNLTKSEGDKVVITIDGKPYKTLDLNTDTTLNIEGEDGEYNLLVIENGVASMKDASCPDLICVHQSDIHFDNETIVCLPNKVVVEIESSESNEIDGIVN